GTRIESHDFIQLFDSGARLFMKQHGNPDQWGEHYPEESMIRMDIEAGNSYVCIENEQIQVVFFIKWGKIFLIKKFMTVNGEMKALTVLYTDLLPKQHRKDALLFVFPGALEQCGNLKIDTHRDNKV
ncbi:GNAT family N-acetyltransferase, partial [Anaerostipes caccae]|uniref:GNAT family N-acetyltransferase n=1 Tax=Anaerostipes caccae TaxID=105841 RepID=UPI00210A4248